MRRPLAIFMTQIGLLIATITLSGWWWRSTTLEPARTARVADEVITSPKVRSLIADQVSSQLAARTGLPVDQLKTTVEQRMADPGFDVAAVSGLLKQAHERLVGVGEGPVQIGQATIASLTGIDVASLGASPEATAPIAWDVPKLNWMADVRSKLDDLIRLGIIVAAGLVISGLLLHPRPEQTLRSVGWWGIGAAAWQVMIAWVLPVYVIPKLTDNPWAEVATGVTKASTSGLIGVLLGLVGGGIACIVASFVVSGARASWQAGERPPTRAPYQPPVDPYRQTRYSAPTMPPSRPQRDDTLDGFGGAHRRPADGDDQRGGWGL
jgi:hypothetical protein